MGVSRLNVCENGKYEYVHAVGMQRTYSYGSWSRIGGRQIVLDSFLGDLHQVPVEIEVVTKAGSNSPVFVIRSGISPDFADIVLVAGGNTYSGELLPSGDVAIRVPARPDTIAIQAQAILKDYQWSLMANVQTLSSEGRLVDVAKADSFIISFPVRNETFFHEEVQGDTAIVKRGSLVWRNRRFRRARGEETLDCTTVEALQIRSD